MARDFIAALTANPVEIAHARRPPRDGGVPEEPGVYAWWLTSEELLPAVPPSRHPAEPRLVLLYIGIAPSGASSKRELRCRTLKNHLGTGLAGSTSRRSLAALLWQEKGWTPRLTPAGRWQLPTADAAALRAWQERNLRLSWVVLDNPRDVEALAIRRLKPPLNLRHNRDHTFYGPHRAARRRFVAEARALQARGGG